MKRVLIGGVAWMACCAATASASAATYCVQPENSSCDRTFTTFQAALNQAGVDTSADTIKLGATTYSDGPFTLSSSNPVAIVGQGQGQTVLTASGGTSGATVLTLGDSSSTLTGVGLVVAPGGTASQPNVGLNLEGTAEQVAIKGPSGSTSLGVKTSAANAVIEDSTITTTNGLAASGTGATVTLTARHDTIIGDGSTGSVGAAATASANLLTPGGATLTLDDSILRGFATDFVSQGASGPPSASDATINVSYDDLDAQPPPGMPPSAIYNKGNNVTEVPGFVNPGASAPDYHLLYSSPLIDAGMTTVESGESTQDEDGNPRLVGGATDIGAYEYQHRPPVITAGVTPSSGQTGATFSYSATASDPDPGDMVTVTWSFDDGGTGSGPSITHAFSTPGTHTATATATDPTGLTATAATTVTVTPPPVPTEPTGPTGPTGPVGYGLPVLSQLKLTPAAFRAARSGPSIAATKGGATVSYTVAPASLTSFIFERAVTGIRRGRSCVTPPRKLPRHAQRCSRFVYVPGSFLHYDVPGTNRFHFTGCVSGKALPPGSYRIDALPQNSALLLGNEATASFRIIAPPPKRHKKT